MHPSLDIMFFCLGNICRSPLAEALFRFHVQAQGFGDYFHIESSGTGAYHVGEPPDPGSIRIARQRLHLDISSQRAQQLHSRHFHQFDYLVAMDRANLRHAQELNGASESTLLLLRDFEPRWEHRGQDVPDPWGYGNDHFEAVYEILFRSTKTFLDHLVTTHFGPARGQNDG